MLLRSHATRLASLLLGLALYGWSLGLMVRADVGLGPWDVLAQGISLLSGAPFGLVTNLIGAGVLLLWIPLRRRPGFGTVVNVLTVGTVAQLCLAVTTTPSGIVLRCLLFAGGMLLLALATGLYVGAGYGPGPRDGLMTGLSSRLGWPIWISRGVVEGSALVVGWLLGGTVGVGTIAFALLIGPLCQLTIPLFRARAARPTRPLRREEVLP